MPLQRNTGRWEMKLLWSLPKEKSNHSVLFILSKEISDKHQPLRLEQVCLKCCFKFEQIVALTLDCSYNGGYRMEDTIM